MRYKVRHELRFRTCGVIYEVGGDDWKNEAV